MNSVEIVGRLTRDPEIRQAGENNNVAHFTVAVNRRFAKPDAEVKADFPSVVAFGKTADFVQKYFHKGSAIGITGRIQTGRYTNKDGVTVYTTDIVAENVEFVESKKAAESNGSGDDFINVPDSAGDEEALPFS